MSAEIAVTVRDLGKLYKIYPDAWSRLIEWGTGGKLVKHQEKWALRGISFDVPRGSALGVVGANGAGKSTLLKVLTGTTPQTLGSFHIEGQVGSLLELGAGFHAEFSGKDNIYMNAAIMGIGKAEVRRRFGEIADFADLGDYIHRPVRTYSSGMAMRLGFAVAMMAHPEILILDEILAVGDQSFQKKCLDRIRHIRQSGTTILFVSHSVYHVRQICDQAIWIHDGVIVTHGDPRNVTDEYVNFQHALAAGQAAQVEQATGEYALASMPHLKDVKVCPVGTTEAYDTYNTGDVVDIHVTHRNPRGTEPCHVGLMLLRNDDTLIFGSRSKEGDVVIEGHEGHIVMRVPLDILSGEYYLSGYLLDESCDHILDQRLAWCRIKVRHDGIEKGVVLANAKWMSPSEVP